MSKRISFRVHGKVQGVFFRDFTRRNANNYNLTGWVRNTPDGKVGGKQDPSHPNSASVKCPILHSIYYFFK
ncbi:hypothetical protein I7I53_05460 [Histoplasma capsulatum var. duboisii H88]|uniref:acylphosphatase n=1 Tax=Ajellomyces capsulatus (strain H88) TaxID=544711 RepID=A0A8A1LYQ8_AJEC8|nr:hypothetical protein I7I53_05460 [Histoplasma capsulatum var. duboisii H88]